MKFLRSHADLDPYQTEYALILKENRQAIERGGAEALSHFTSLENLILHGDPERQLREELFPAFCTVDLPRRTIYLLLLLYLNEDEDIIIEPIVSTSRMLTPQFQRYDLSHNQIWHHERYCITRDRGRPLFRIRFDIPHQVARFIAVDLVPLPTENALSSESDGMSANPVSSDYED